MSATRGNGKAVEAEVPSKDLSCGLVMPISLLDGCTPDHWAEVKGIIIEAIDSIQEFKFTTRLVSDADEIGVIQKRIIHNVYDSSMVVCDVSGKNPNVMFELGMRLAFDKPTVIIKDDKTDYSFDTGVIEHLGYPRDLRFGKMVEFKKKLAEKVVNTYRVSHADSGHSPFLKSFGEFHVASLSQTEASPERAMFEMLIDIQRDVALLKNSGGNNPLALLEKLTDKGVDWTISRGKDGKPLVFFLPLHGGSSSAKGTQSGDDSTPGQGSPSK